jgi:hypothetical protein
MCAAALAPARFPSLQREEGLSFWEQLITECRDHVVAINSALLKHGYEPADCIDFRVDGELQMVRSGYPSTTVYANIEFESWGPVIRGSIRGHQRPDFRFYPEEFEMPIATDSDGSMVAIFDEGKSLRPNELATYLVQTFRRCFPRVALPCPGSAHA